ncbi:MAG: hypothetical protein FJY91_01550 [Candidatus Harrisonbacteria bacterium]|nr:hypothetical protein [Candidatus Harrisonbacteria bacterium]
MGDFWTGDFVASYSFYLLLFVDIYGWRSRADLDKFGAEVDSVDFSELEKGLIGQEINEDLFYKGGVGR